MRRAHVERGFIAVGICDSATEIDVRFDVIVDVINENQLVHISFMKSEVMKDVTWIMSPRKAYSDHDSMSWVAIDLSVGPVDGIAAIVATKKTCVKSLIFSMLSIRSSGTKCRSKPSVVSSRPSLIFKLTSNTLFFGPLDGSRALGNVIIAMVVIVIEPGVVARDIVY